MNILNGTDNHSTHEGVAKLKILRDSTDIFEHAIQSNYGNWMYISGVGNDPRDRKFDIQWQAQRYDSNSRFQNLWLQKTLFK